MPGRHQGNSLAAARERYLEVAKDPQHVRQLVVASWQRSMEHEVNTSALDTPYVENPNLDSPLVRAAQPILDRLIEQLAGDPVSTMITDRDGVVLARRVSHEGLTTRLNGVQLAPGHVYSERYAGTNGIGTALASGRPVTIVGSEHYVEVLRAFQCAAVPILHPTRRTLLGAFNLTTPRQGSSGMLMALARSTARQIESEIAAISSRRERALFHDYMQACTSVRPGPVLALSRDIVMMNEQLRAAVAGQDHYALLEHAQEIADDSEFEGTPPDCGSVSLAKPGSVRPRLSKPSTAPTAQSTHLR
jgi:transcriptional regulator of acetoin/glycerol metabolism